MSKKYTITKTIELPDDFIPEDKDCEVSCPFRYYIGDLYKYDWDCGLEWCCPFKNEDGWKCEEIK